MFLSETSHVDCQVLDVLYVSKLHFSLMLCFFIVGVMVKDIFPELRLDVPNIEKQIAPNMLCLRDIEVLLHLPF